MMKVGLSTWSLHQNCGRGVENPAPRDVFGCLDLAHEWQLDGLQIEQFPEDPDSLDRIASTAYKYGLVLEMETWGFDPSHIEARLDLAKALGIKIVRTFAGLNRYRTEVPLAQQIDRSVRNLELIGEYAEARGLYVAVENHQDPITDHIRSQDISAGELAELLDRVDSPFVGVCLDPGNALAYLEDPIEITELLAPRVFAMHVKDYRIKRTFRGAEIAGCVLGEGAVDVRETLRIVAERSPFGQDVCLSIEAPVERLQIPFLEPGYWAGYTDEDAMRLPKYLQLLAAKGESPEADLRTPAEQGRPLREILDHELHQVAASIAFVRGLVREIP